MILGDALYIPLADRSVHCVVTSPPYWGQRDYGYDDLRCIGNEASPEEYVKNLAGILFDVRRVLRDDGTLWLNLGDCSFGDSPLRSRSRDQFDPSKQGVLRRGAGGTRRSAASVAGLKPKDLVGLPWRVAFALRDQGWYLRSDIIWSKPNPMPESIRDRPTRSHEHIFLLAKARHYYYDADAIREASTFNPSDWRAPGVPRRSSMKRGEFNSKNTERGKEAFRAIRSARNSRDVWLIATTPYGGAHFAAFPERLVERCIRAGTPTAGVCPTCGAPLKRNTDRTPLPRNDRRTHSTEMQRLGRMPAPEPTSGESARVVVRTESWIRTCQHHIEKPVPAIVLDPFMGSGTTLAVAERLGRRGVGIDLNPAYFELARERLARLHLRLIGGIS